jgi:FlaG/FlaF family flagellin (archaellin)
MIGPLAGRDRGVSTGVSVMLMVAVALVLGVTLSAAFGATASELRNPPPTATFEHTKTENGADSDTVELTLTGGERLRADRLLLVATTPVDLGGSETPPNPGYATVGEKLTEGDDQTEIGSTWDVGETVLFGAGGDLEGETIRLVWNPVEVEKDGANGREPSDVIGENSHVLLKFTVQ